MIDHHVDRPGVEAQQCAQLTGPNRSIGFLLTAPIHKRAARGRAALKKTSNARCFRRKVSPTAGAGLSPCARRRDRPRDAARDARDGFDDLVAMARGPAPDPIPNSAVKTLSADGTAS